MSWLVLWTACAGEPAGVPLVEPEPAPVVEASTVGDAFPPPRGAERVSDSAFGAWLRAMAVEPASVPVRAHDGRDLGHPGRVIDLPLVKGDLQQCADTAIRVRAEWERAQGIDPTFHATSGDPMPWSRYAAGERPYESGGRIAWKAGGDRSWEGWLGLVFTWAGTRSLAYDTVAASDPAPGDLLVDPGSPGHAVVLLDVARRGDDTLLLVGQGFMPAQSFHVVVGPDAGWWPWEPGLTMPHWAFDANQLRRWK